MLSIFLSYSFRNDGSPLLTAVRDIIGCAGFRDIDGKVLDGPVLLPEIQSKMSKCNGTVCVMSKEAAETGWVTAEFFTAMATNSKKTLMLCEQSLELPAPHQGLSAIRYTDGNELPAIATLAATLGVWRQQLGNSVLAVLLPDDVGEQALQQSATCEYRCMEASSYEESDWQSGRLRPIDMGIHAILPEVPANHSVQVRLTFGGRIWTSPFTPQTMRLELNN